MLKFLRLLSPSICGRRLIEAAEAFEDPPLNRAARRYAVMSVCLLVATAALLLTAALVDTLANARPMSEAIGWTGIVCMNLCIYSGLRYRAANRRCSERNARSQTEAAEPVDPADGGQNAPP